MNTMKPKSVLSPFIFRAKLSALLVCSALLMVVICTNAGEIAPAGEKLAAFLDSMNVEEHWLAGQHVNWRTGDPGTNTSLAAVTRGGSTHCSAFAAAAAEKLGVYLLHPPEHSDLLLANAQQNWLESGGATNGWQPVKSPLEAQALANRGELVVVTFKSPDPKKPGHIAIVRPSTKSDDDILAEGPQVVQAGKFNHNSTTAKDGFKNHPGAFEKNLLLYFVHTTAVGQPVAIVPPARFAITNGLPLRYVGVYVNKTNSSGKSLVLVFKGILALTNTVVRAINAEDIRAGALTNLDVALFPGGSGHIQAAVLGEEGLKNIKSFVQNGGKYIGICAGAYLATSGYPWSLHILNARTISTNWTRGIGTVKVELTGKGHEVFGNELTLFDCHYGNGPVITPAGLENLPAFETLAFFRTELAEHNTPVGIMVNSPAIYTAPYGRGRVVCFTPHPEMTPGIEWMIGSAVTWLTENKSSTTSAENKL
jgi:glutamine amidotransferase-like uncharacterized protein